MTDTCWTKYQPDLGELVLGDKQIARVDPSLADTCPAGISH